MDIDADYADGNDADVAANAPLLTYATFDAAPGVAFRVFYNSGTGNIDPSGDATLRALHLAGDPFSRDFDTQLYAELVSRPFILCKRSNGGTSLTEFLFTRPGRSRDIAQPLVPFDVLADAAAPPIVLFDNATLVPMLVGRVVDIDMAPRAASGRFTFVVEEELEEVLAYEDEDEE